jgi:hypothetical protein
MISSSLVIALFVKATLQDAPNQKSQPVNAQEEEMQ